MPVPCSLARSAIGLGFAVNSTKASTPTQKRRSLIATAVFFSFGLSDIVEVQTGGWWKPWWLFLWKASCVLTMLELLVNYLMEDQHRQKENIGQSDSR